MSLVNDSNYPPDNTTYVVNKSNKSIFSKIKNYFSNLFTYLFVEGGENNIKVNQEQNNSFNLSPNDNLNDSLKDYPPFLMDLPKQPNVKIKPDILSREGFSSDEDNSEKSEKENKTNHLLKSNSSLKRKKSNYSNKKLNESAQKKIYEEEYISLGVKRRRESSFLSPVRKQSSAFKNVLRKQSSLEKERDRNINCDSSNYKTLNEMVKIIKARKRNINNINRNQNIMEEKNTLEEELNNKNIPMNNYCIVNEINHNIIG
ncbi:MAG: hypothetical protein MJ252_04105, partial [archaeon]|nr:hypothetical protein [archaeon]